MRAGAMTKMLAALGVATLLASSDLCLLLVCTPAQARPGAAGAMAANGCGGGRASTGGHPDHGASDCGRPCNLLVTLGSTPQLSALPSVVPQAPSASLAALLAVDEPAGIPSPNASARREHSPPRPPLLDAPGVRAPPSA